MACGCGDNDEPFSSLAPSVEQTPPQFLDRFVVAIGIKIVFAEGGGTLGALGFGVVLGRPEKRDVT